MFEYVIGVLAILKLYQSVSLFIFKRRSREPIRINKASTPFFWRSGKKIALMIHGFTSSPHEFRKLAKLLAENNISSYAPLLPGHGTSPERLAVTKYQEWIEFVEEQIKMLEEEYEEIYLIGNSFGGNLSIIYANSSKKIKGLVTLGTPIIFRHEKKAKYLVLPLLKRIKLFQKKRFRKYTSKRAPNQDGAYSSIPLRSIKDLLKVVRLSKENLKKIKVPILVMQTKNDSVTDPESAEYILNNVSSKNKRLFIVPDSYHVFIADKYAPLANNEILKFIKYNSKH